MGLVAEGTIGKQDTAQDEDFSLVLGGLTYRLLLRWKLIERPLGRLSWRIGVITAVAWLPLVVFTILGGRFAGNVKTPFLFDFEAHARLLFALPLLMLSELFVHARMRALTAQFVERQIVTEAVRPAFNSVVSSAIHLRNSVAAETSLLIAAILLGPHIWRGTAALRSEAWYATDLNLTSAGDWYAFVSVPIFQFFLLRWYYRVAIWCRFLFQISRLDLNLVALHPDRCCGLGFLGDVVFSFAPILMAHSGIVAGFVANRLIQKTASLSDYRFELVGLAILLLAIVLGPLCVFVPKLYGARLAGLRSYGAFASDYVAGFSRKWTSHANPDRDSLLGSPDIQSLADLANSFAAVKEVRLFPFGKNTIIGFLVAIALPLLPLAFTMFSPEELLKRLISILL